MQPEFKSSPKAHVIRIILTLISVVIVGTFLRFLFLPDEFGKHGHYHPGAVEQEANREARSMTSESCFDCHPLMRELHVEGIHKTVSCEACHGAYADHVKNDVVIADMPVVRGENIRSQCIRCHNKVIQARPPEAIKLVALPEHLQEKNVRVVHICNQCHHVHSPLKWVHEAREMVGLPIERGDP